MTHLNNIIRLLTVAIVASLTGCIEEYNVELPSDQSRVLVVEGTIYSDSVSTFYLSQSVPVNSEESCPPVDNAKLIIIGSDGMQCDVRHSGSGTYTAETPKLDADKEYHLQITYDGETYESLPQKPLKTIGIENVEANQVSEDSNIDVLITTALPDDPSETQYFSWHYDETWVIRPELTTTVMYDAKNDTAVPISQPYPGRGWMFGHGSEIIASSSAYYQNNKIAGYKIYDIDITERKIWETYSTNVIQRAITKSEYEYEIARRQVSAEMGGLFTPQPSSLPSNIRCTTGNSRVIGFVGCSLNTTQHRVFIDGHDYSVIRVNHAIIQKSTDEGFPGDMYLYNLGWKLIYWQEDPVNPRQSWWTEERFLDVRLLGATTVKPDYWKD